MMFYDGILQAKFFWKHTIEGEVVEFDNTPFIVSQIRKLDCQFGSHYYKEKRNDRSKRTCLQGTRKIGCKAHITVHVITLYPDFCITKREISSVSCRGLKELKKQKISQLRDALANNNSITLTTKCYINLPEEEAHHAFHETQGAVSYAQRIHPKLIEKIHELVSEGLTEVQEIKRALKHYVQHILCPDIKPGLTDRSYYPTSMDVRNHVYLAQRACQLSKLDQENLQLKVEQWKKDNTKSNYFFRPYKHLDSKLDSGELDLTFEQTLLYIHQEPWQQELMVRYGNTISLMDATYKTTRYELALFFVAVKTKS